MGQLRAPFDDDYLLWCDVAIGQGDAVVAILARAQPCFSEAVQWVHASVTFSVWFPAIVSLAQRRPCTWA